MSKQTKKKLVPELRFPEFVDKDTWIKMKLSEVLFEHGTKSEGGEEVYSVSVHKGVINQIEHLGRSFAAANTDHYKRVLPGDVIYTKSPTRDFPYGIIKQSKVSKPVIVSPLYGVFTPETNAIGVILDAYFKYPERTFNYLESIVQKGAKNTINIKNDVFLSKSLVLPQDSKEQQKIATFLSSLDDLLDAENQKLEGLKAHKKCLLQQLFPTKGEKVPQLRFPEFEDSGEWKETTLGHKEVSSFVSKKARLEELRLENYVSTENILPDYSGIKIASKLPPLGSFTKFKEGDILISNIRPYLKKVWLSSIVGAASNDIIVVRAGVKVNELFLSFLLRNDAFINYVMKSAKGVKMPRGDKSAMMEYHVMLPQKAEQQKIAACLSTLDEWIAAQAEKIEGLKAHKKGLMQGLFPALKKNV